MTSPFDPLKYGWHLTYAVEIEGIPVRWSEIPTGAALPTGFSESACLVIDGSGEVGQTIDRDVGLGAGLPLGFRLLDFLPQTGLASAVPTWIKRFARATNLTANVSAALTSIPVVSTAGFAVPGTIWLGAEAITYAAVDATHFGTGGTPAVRGAYNSLRSLHYLGTVAGVATDLPRWWRGREARLWAYPVDPTGYVPGDRFEVWRGHISTGPDRDGAGWQFEALAIDRRLASPAVPAITGKVITSQPSAQVFKSDAVFLKAEGYDFAVPPVKLYGFQIVWFPYDSLADGTILTVSQQKALIASTWLTARNAALNTVGGAADANLYLGPIYFPLGQAGETNVYLTLIPNVLISGVKVSVYSKNIWPKSPMTPWVTGGSAYNIPLWIVGLGADVMVPLVLTLGQPAPKAPQFASVAIQLDTVDAVAPSTGTIQCDNKTAWYKSATTTGGVVWISGLYVQTGLMPAFADGAQVELGFTLTGVFPDIMRKVLESSGTAAERGTYDTLAYGQGYALQAPTGAGATATTAAIDEISFTSVQGTVAAMLGSVAGTGQSFADLFGGVLALAKMAVVARSFAGTTPLAPTIRLRAVQTSSAGGAYTATITDAELLTNSGEPVKTIRKRTVPNALKVQIKHGNETGDSIQVVDQPAVVDQGRQEIVYTLPLDGTIPDTQEVVNWASSILLAAQTAQAIEIRIVPWIVADVGDCVRLVLTHWGVWSWITGARGYTGPGRVIGRNFDLKTGAVTLTLLVDSAPTTSLCPAMLVTAYDVAAAPTRIDVADRYLPYLQQVLAVDGSPAPLDHYRPGYGTESAFGSYTFTTVADLGTGDCRITGITVVGGAVLAANSYLTTPTNALGGDYQDAFAHTLDGTAWQ